MDEFYNENHFDFQVISSGEFLDSPPGYEGDTFLVKTETIRLNPIAMNEWGKAQVLNSRYTYETVEQWEAYKAMKKERMNIFEKKIAEALRIDTNMESLCITQALSEVFTVVHIRENKRAPFQMPGRQSREAGPFGKLASLLHPGGLSIGYSLLTGENGVKMCVK